MPTPRQVSLRFPIGGVVRRHAIQTQQPFTTPDALNIWPTDHDSGRERGGVRPGISTTEIGGGGFGNPRSWCFATWLDTSNSLHEGVAVGTSTGVWTYDGSWTKQINGGASFTDACVYRNVLFQANGGGTVTVENLGNPASGANFHGDGNLTTRVEEWVAADPLDADGAPTRFGVAPENCGICIAWMDRVWFAGDTTNPQVLYASAVGNYLNYDYSDVTKGGAYTTSGSDGGVITGRITSLIDHGSNCMLVGARDEMYVVRDNPRGGGYQLNIARHVGPLSQTAWCKDENNRTWFLSRKGLHVIPS